MEESTITRKSKKKRSTLTQNQTEVISDLQKRFFDDDNNYIDYFIEVGVKPEIFKNKTLYLSNNPDEINQILIPQIITKFPNFDKKLVVIENTMIQQIFPHGFKLVESKKKPIPIFYCLVLDNQLYSAIYTRKYLACFIIYESIEDYKKLYDKYQKEDEKFSSIINNININNKSVDTGKERYKNYYIPKCLCLVSVHPYIEKFEEILRTIYNISTSEMYSYIFIDQIIEKLVIETPKIPRGLKRIVLKFPNNEIELTETKMNEYPSINVNLSFTFEILSYNTIIEIYKYLLYETKLIFFSENLYKLTNTILSFLSLLTPFNYQFQTVSILPKELYSFLDSISPFIFGINNKYNENFFENNKISIENTTIGIIDIDNDRFFVIAPGGVLNQKDYPELPKKLRKKLEERLKNYLLNIKKKNSFGSYIFSNQITHLVTLEEQIQRSSTYKNNNMNIIINTLVKKQSNLNKPILRKFNTSNENKEIQNIFSKFMINLLKDYPKFLTKDYSVNRDISQNIKDIIDIKSYLNLYSNGERCFYSKIFSTQMFIEFIYKRMMPKDCNEKVEVLFIEETINEKLSEKNIFSKIGKSKNAEDFILLHCKDYDYDNEDIVIDLTGDKGLTNGFKCYLLSNKLSLNSFLNNGYDISINQDNKNISFKYPIFPSLLSDKLFILNSEEYQKPNMTLHKKIEEINIKIVNKSSLKFIQEKTILSNSEIQNNLYLCYLIIWSMAFWYMDEDERETRFYEMLEILEKVEEHDVKVFEILFKTLVDHSRDENIILLYKKFIDLRLNPSWEMFSMVSKIFKKKNNINKKKLLLDQESNLEKRKLLFNTGKKIQNKESFARRTFKIQNKDDFIFSNKVLFYAYCICRKCNNIVNIGEICSNLKSLKMEKDTHGFERIKCNNKNKEGKLCEHLCEQNFKFKFGQELYTKATNSNQAHKYVTSIPFSIILLSPSEIKNNLLQLALNKKKDDHFEHFDIVNFRTNYPDIFWSLIWFFDINNIDKSFMLPYENSLRNHKFKAKNSKIEYFYSIHEKEEDMAKNKNINKKIHIINSKTDIKKLNVFKNRKRKSKYNTDDLCVQNVYEFAIIENIGILTFKNLSIYEKNISYNEMPLLPCEKDNYSLYYGSFLFNNDSESSTRISTARDSLLSYQLKKNIMTLGNVGFPGLSQSGPGPSGVGLKFGMRDSVLTKCIVFEESDDSVDE